MSDTAVFRPWLMPLTTRCGTSGSSCVTPSLMQSAGLPLIAKLKDSVGGPVMIAKVAGQQAAAGVVPFLQLMAYLSIMLAFMNILPIPALDGGHLVFILVEGIIRREVPLKIRVAVQQVGFALLLLFMAFVLYNDVARVIGN